MSIAGRVYTVTGSSSGIGHALTLLLVENGAIVYGSDVNQKGLDATKDECKGLPGRLETTVLDVRKDEAVKGWVKSCVEKEGKLDGSANVAGVSADKPASVGEIVSSQISELNVGTKRLGVCFGHQPHGCDAMYARAVALPYGWRINF
jgi:NAD(P)-dependent dehydrogenase (short-subunit alcohol dehydrogenase family)